MTKKLDKFLLLTWKNWLLQYRRPVQTVFEIISPIIFSGVLLFIRSLVDPEKYNGIIYRPFCTIPFPSDVASSVCSENPEPIDDRFFHSYWAFKLVYVPKSPVLENVMKSFEVLFSEVENVENSTQLGVYLKKEDLSRTFAIVQFDDSYKNLKDFGHINKFRVSIRYPGELRVFDDNDTIWNWKTNLIFPILLPPGPRTFNSTTGGSPHYHKEGFLFLQHMLTLALLAAKDNIYGINNIGGWLSKKRLPLISMRRFPYSKWYEDSLRFPLQMLLGIIMLLSFVYPCINMVRSITTEKEKQLKESMKIMGLPNWLHWLAWFAKYFVFLLISSLLLVIMLTTRWKPSSDFTIFTYSDPSLIMVFFLCYISATITMCFAISVMFNKANTAAAVAGFVWFVTYVPYLLFNLKFESLNLPTKLLFCLFSNSAMGFGLKLVIKFEGIGAGMQWSSVFQRYNPDDPLTAGHVMIMLCFDAVFYHFIALYIEAVFPGEFGVPKPWYFFCTTNYWRGSLERQESDVSFFGYSPERDLFEPEPLHLRVGIQITNLRKVFRKRAAVENLSLNMYEDQITVLLGHNGAGKTTTMSMLTGMITPTSGTAKINGYDIRVDMDGVRQSLGLCPQHNIIFDELTVEEHLYFFSKLKGLHKNEIKEEIDKYVALLELEDKRHSKSKTLSGGMKRKLCVGMALCGKSKVVMLDEPTAGMDPSARRALWILLKREKEGRTMLLTTHFMDEADLLGDRIAIMAAGNVKCCGSSFFLKKKYGTGYSLILEKSTNCDVDKVTALLKKHIPEIEVQGNVGSELTYLLTERQSSKFPTMLKELEDNFNKLGVLSYGISLTTMEEVFMKVGADHATEDDDFSIEEPTDITDLRSNQNFRPQYTESFDLLMNQFRAMFMKRILATYRSWLHLLMQILSSIAFVIIPIMVVRIERVMGLMPPRNMNLNQYTNPVTLIEKGVDSNYKNQYLNYLKRNSFDYEMVGDIGKTYLGLTKTSPVTASMNYIVGASFIKNESIGREQITAWFNNNPYHSPGVALSLVLNAIFRDTLGCNDCYIQFINHPMPYDMYVQMEVLLFVQSLGFQVAWLQGFSMAFVTAFYVLFIIKERSSKSKHLQIISGAKVLVFWLTTAIWDTITLSLVICFILGTFLIFQEDGFRTASDFGRLITILFLFVWSCLPLIYLSGYFFKIPASGFTKIVIFNTFTGVVAFLIVDVLRFMPTTRDLGESLMLFFLIFPYYCLVSSIQDSYAFYTIKKICKKCRTQLCPPEMANYCQGYTESYYKWASPGIGRYLTFMFLMGFVFYFILLAVEFKVFSRMFYYLTQHRIQEPSSESVEEDTDVLEEKTKIRNASQEELNEYSLVLRDLTKYYKKFLAVNSLCLGVKDLECFGLLGINGAGKTTTFEMMTGDIRMTYGDGYVKGFSIKHQFKEVQKCIGYCPQFDALLDDMTAKETIIMFALLRGIHRKNCDALAETLAREFDFLRHLNKQVRALSGGNKRKLSAAIAIIGDPPVIYLDEPTTGMDPATKRYLWNTLCKIRDSGKCLVLTSHSMEECEALCTRLAIMVNGQFKCLGSSQHLKNKFAKGYNLTIKLRKSGELETYDTAPIEAFIKAQIPKTKLREKHEELLYYHIKDLTKPCSELFSILEKAKKGNFNIEDYSLGQSSLEQVFLTFTRLQK